MHNRPVYLNLFRLQLPLAGWVSILHRISGVFLFLVLPSALYLLELSLEHQAGFEQVTNMMDGVLARSLLFLTFTSLALHVFAGIRHLALDVHWGVARKVSRQTAIWVLVAALLAMLLIGWRIFL
jgi:succinate dehydrogenase / fumarate reductase cytochrome b subunit